jgi:hypothetical protein
VLPSGRHGGSTDTIPSLPPTAIPFHGLKTTGGIHSLKYAPWHFIEMCISELGIAPLGPKDTRRTQGSSTQSRRTSCTRSNNKDMTILSNVLPCGVPSILVILGLARVLYHPSLRLVHSLYAVLTSGWHAKCQDVGRASAQWAILRRASRAPFFA